MSISLIGDFAVMNGNSCRPLARSVLSLFGPEDMTLHVSDKASASVFSDEVSFWLLERPILLLGSVCSVMNEPVSESAS